MDNKHMKECFKPHTMLHSIFGLGLGLLIGAILQLHGMTEAALGIVVIAIAFIGDFMMGMKKKVKK